VARGGQQRARHHGLAEGMVQPGAAGCQQQLAGIRQGQAGAALLFGQQGIGETEGVHI
jgi:hypothetical protein